MCMRSPWLPYALALVILAGGCATTPKMSPMQLRQLTTRTIQGGYENVFKATMTVLQDNSYIIKQTDMQAGLITAEVNREASGWSQFFQALASEDEEIPSKGTVVEASAVVGKISEKTTEVRITIQEKTYSSAGKTTKVKQIHDPEIYRSLFNDITVEVKRREALGR